MVEILFAPGFTLLCLSCEFFLLSVGFEISATSLTGKQFLNSFIVFPTALYDLSFCGVGTSNISRDRCHGTPDSPLVTRAARKVSYGFDPEPVQFFSGAFFCLGGGSGVK